MSTATAEEKKPSETPNADKMEGMSDHETEMNILQFKLGNDYMSKEEYDAAVAELEEKEKNRQLSPEEKEKKEAEAKVAKDKVDAEAKAKADEEAKKKADEEAAAKAKEVKSEPKPASKVDDEAVQRAAELAAEKVAEKFKPAPVVDEFESKLPRAYQKDLRVAKFMAETDPRHKGLPGQLTDFYKAEAAYMADWEKNNPGKQFKADDEDHEAFYERNEPKIDPDELEEAKEAMVRKQVKEEVVSEVREQVVKELKPKVDAVEFKEKERAEAPKIVEQADAGMVQMLSQIEDPDVKAALVVDGKVVLTEESSKKLDEINTDKREIVDEEASLVNFLLKELHSINRLGDQYNPDPRAFRVLSEFALGVEEQFKGKEAKDGRTIITQSDLNDRVGKIIKADIKPEQKKAAIRDLDQKFTVLPTEIVAEELVKTAAKRTNHRLTQLNKLIEKYSGAKLKNGDETHTDPTENPPAEETTEETEEARHKPPATTSATDKVGSGKGGGMKPPLTEEQIIKANWG